MRGERERESDSDCCSMMLPTRLQTGIVPVLLLVVVVLLPGRACTPSTHSVSHWGSSSSNVIPRISGVAC